MKRNRILMGEEIMGGGGGGVRPSGSDGSELYQCKITIIEYNDSNHSTVIIITE
jgi:hypothetical protein